MNKKTEKLERSGLNPDTEVFKVLTGEEPIYGRELAVKGVDGVNYAKQVNFDILSGPGAISLDDLICNRYGSMYKFCLITQIKQGRVSYWVKQGWEKLGYGTKQKIKYLFAKADHIVRIEK